MATYTLIPSSLTGGKTITNASGAYTNTSSTTYAVVLLNSSYTSAWLGGFDFDFVSDETIISVTIKCKVKNSSSCYIRVYSSSDSNRVALSSTVNGANVSSDGLITFSLTSSKDVILSYLAGGTLCIAIYVSSSISYGISPQIYGAEVIVETDATPKANKVIYGGNTILDLTEDTVTRAKVLSGTTFHLPNGVQSVGTLSVNGATVKNVTKELSMNGSSITFTGLSDEPKCFIVRVKDKVSYNSSTSNYKIVYITYDGTNTTGAYLRGGTNTSTSGVIYNDTKYSFTYSSGSLTVSSSGSSSSAGGGFIIGEWELIYAY